MTKITPLELIEKGIIEHNWQMVQDGYGQMTDRSVSATKEKKQSKKKIKTKTIEILTESTDDDLLNKFRVPPPTYGVTSDGKNAARRISFQPKEIKYVTATKKEFKEEASIDRKLTAGLKPTTRRKANYVEINCAKCHNGFEVVDSVAAQFGTDPEGELPLFYCDNCVR